MGAALQQEGPDGALRPLAFLSPKLSGSQLNWSPREKECYARVAALLKWHGWVGNKRVEVRTDHRSLENWATEDFKTVGVPLNAKHVGMNCSLNSTSMWFTLRGQWTPWVISCPVGLTLLTRRWVMCPYMGRPKRPGMCGT